MVIANDEGRYSIVNDRTDSSLFWWSFLGHWNSYPKDPRCLSTVDRWRLWLQSAASFLSSVSKETLQWSERSSASLSRSARSDRQCHFSSGAFENPRHETSLSHDDPSGRSPSEFPLSTGQRLSIPLLVTRPMPEESSGRRSSHEWDSCGDQNEQRQSIQSKPVERFDQNERLESDQKARINQCGGKYSFCKRESLLLVRQDLVNCPF